MQIQTKTKHIKTHQAHTCGSTHAHNQSNNSNTIMQPAQAQTKHPHTNTPAKPK